MGGPVAHSTSDTARLFVDAPSFAVGWATQVLIPQPAAGAQWSYKGDGRFLTRVVGMRFTFTADAVVGNRFQTVQLIDNNGVIITEVVCSGTLAASNFHTTNLFVRSPSYDFGGNGGGFGWIPDLLIPPDWEWQSQVIGMDPGDQISGVVLLIHQYPNDAAVVTAGE